MAALLPSGGPLAAARALRHTSSSPSLAGAGAVPYEASGRGSLARGGSLALNGSQGSSLGSSFGGYSRSKCHLDRAMGSPGQASSHYGGSRPGTGCSGSGRSAGSTADRTPKGASAWQAMAWPDRFGEPMPRPPPEQAAAAER
mmetsp:Transcript_68818/g.201549  ORF Transcript_68818/g.201549 Transcript_68818/m.201549 type:complete len:143 (-) Transcript_68818:250-678(-)